jgi:multicomponent Na+:H+ antiporter subunit D
MSLDQWMPLLVLLTSLSAALVIFLLPEQRHATRGALNLAAALIKLGVVAVMLVGVAAGAQYEVRFPLVGGIDFALRADPLAMLFTSLSAVLWLFTTLYAIGYLENAPNNSRFFGFFSLCVTSTMGIALAANLFTFLLFYELLTLSTYPLVVHRGTARALRAGRIYLAYTLGGGALLLLGVAWLYGVAGPTEFTQNGALDRVATDAAWQLSPIWFLLMAGLGVKTALVPLHGWLPTAMVAPAPVSALLHAVAVVKAGAFGIVRVVYDVYGVALGARLGLLQPLLVLSAFTIVYASVRALFQTDLKRMLAFSTVSQVAYIVLGIAMFGPLGSVGGLVHLVHQGIMKVTLFFCAGVYAETLGMHRIDELDGVGRRLPATSIAFTLAAFGMIGMPPLAGFISKWYLGAGALAAGQPWVVGVLLLSTLLNAGYFLPVVYRLWFGQRRTPLPRSRLGGRLETSGLLLWPTLGTAAISVLAGLFAASSLSPLAWAMLIVDRQYSP